MSGKKTKWTMRSNGSKQRHYTGKWMRYKQWLNELKAHPCADCRIQYPPCAMDFDHVRGTKIAEISSMWDSGLPRRLAEIAKCDLVCANCHRVRTNKRLGSPIAHPSMQETPSVFQGYPSLPSVEGYNAYA